MRLEAIRTTAKITQLFMLAGTATLLVLIMPGHALSDGLVVSEIEPVDEVINPV